MLRSWLSRCPFHLEIDLAVNNVHDVAADPDFFAFLAQMDAAGTLEGGALGPHRKILRVLRR